MSSRAQVMNVRFNVKSNDALMSILRVVKYISDPDINLVGTEELPDGTVDVVLEDKNASRTENLKTKLGG